MNNFIGFVAGTWIRSDGQGKEQLRNIQNIKIGDKVLSRPESGEDELSYQSVTQTYCYPDKPIWLLGLAKNYYFFDKNYELIKNSSKVTTAPWNMNLLVTPNHPVYVVGMSNKDNVEVKFYESPTWKRVDELKQHEVCINKDGLYYQVERAQPLYFYQGENDTETNPNLYWYQEHYYEDYQKDYVKPFLRSGDDPELMEDEEQYKNTGWVYDVREYEENGLKGRAKKISVINIMKDIDSKYIPFIRNVYNLEVENTHTYFAESTGLWVHNTSSLVQAILQTARDIENKK